MKHKYCPKCCITWESLLSMPEDLLDTGLYGSLDNCKIVAEDYGWTEKNDIRFGKNVVG